MGASTVAVLTLLIFAAAVLYSSVGHAGASGYLAMMALAGMAPEVMKPTALVLNIVVATIATVKFQRAGCFNWKLFWPFATLSIPLAAVGGAIQLPGLYYRPIVGLVLLWAAARFLMTPRNTTDVTHPLPLLGGMMAGGAIGLLSGLTGVGGGIFLSPLLIFMRWAGTRETAGVSALFILVNSIAGLAGHRFASLSHVPTEAAWWALAAIAGGWIGSELGSRHASTVWLRRLLGVVLVVAGLKMIFVGNGGKTPPRAAQHGPDAGAGCADCRDCHLVELPATKCYAG